MFLREESQCLFSIHIYGDSVTIQCGLTTVLDINFALTTAKIKVAKQHIFVITLQVNCTRKITLKLN